MWSIRKVKVIAGLLFVALLWIAPGTAIAEPLACATGSNSQWGSGWCNLAPPVDLARGDRLRMLIGGTAKKILVRLLPKGQAPDTATGIVGGAIDVPGTRIVEVTLPEDRRQIAQISVHGGPTPFDVPLGGGNGAATLVSVDVSRR